CRASCGVFQVPLHRGRGSVLHILGSSGSFGCRCLGVSPGQTPAISIPSGGFLQLHARRTMADDKAAPAARNKMVGADAGADKMDARTLRRAVSYFRMISQTKVIPYGGGGFRAHGVKITRETVDAARNDAALFAAYTGGKADDQLA